MCSRFVAVGASMKDSNNTQQGCVYFERLYWSAHMCELQLPLLDVQRNA